MKRDYYGKEHFQYPFNILIDKLGSYKAILNLYLELNGVEWKYQNIWDLCHGQTNISLLIYNRIKMTCEHLNIKLDESFCKPYEVEIADEEEQYRQWRRRIGK